ncbi:MAG: TSUP family transporter [candidate division NC10 bacterium]
MPWRPRESTRERDPPGALGKFRPVLALGPDHGFLGGLVGQGGSFILIPLMLWLLRLPLRIVLGSNLAIVTLASFSGFLGNLLAWAIHRSWQIWAMEVSPLKLFSTPATLCWVQIRPRPAFLLQNILRW